MSIDQVSEGTPSFARGVNTVSNLSAVDMADAVKQPYTKTPEKEAFDAREEAFRNIIQVGQVRKVLDNEPNDLVHLVVLMEQRIVDLERRIEIYNQGAPYKI